MKTRILPGFCIALILAFFNTTSAAAAEDGIFYGDSIPAGSVIENDVILIGQEVQLDGEVHGNVFILGNQVIINGTIDGSLILIAQNASLGGDVSGSAYVLALTLNLPAQTILERDLYAAIVSLTSDSDSTLSRHLYALGLDAGLNGRIEGELHTMLGPIQLYNGLMRLLGFEELTLELHFEIPAPASSSQAPETVRYLRIKLLEPLPAFDWGAWALKNLKQWAVMLVFGLLGLFLLRKPIDQAGIPLVKRPWTTLGVGVIVLVVSLNLFIVGLLMFVLVFALGLGLNFLGLWQVTLALWVVAFSALLIALVALALFISTGSKVLVAFTAASLLSGLIFKRKTIWISILSLAVGSLFYALLRSIPYAGWVIDLLVTSAGMGAVWIILPRTGKASLTPAKKTPARIH